MKKFLTVFLLSAGCTAAYEPITDDSYYPGKYAPSESMTKSSSTSATLRPEPKPTCRWVLGRDNQRLYRMGDNCVETTDRSGDTLAPVDRKDTPVKPPKPVDTPSKPTAPEEPTKPTPEKPNKPTPEKPNKPTPEKPSKPSKPTSEKPSKPSKPERLGNPGNDKPVGRAGEKPNKKDGWGGGSRGRSDG